MLCGWYRRMFERYTWVRAHLEEQFGDTSFTSFVRMIIKKGRKVSQDLCVGIFQNNFLSGLQKPRQKQLWIGQALETICEQVFGLTISNVVTTFY